MKVPLFCGRDVERDNVGHKKETQRVKLCDEGSTWKWMSWRGFMAKAFSDAGLTPLCGRDLDKNQLLNSVHSLLVTI